MDTGRTIFSQLLDHFPRRSETRHQRNDLCFRPLTIAKIYKARWQEELFFKWIKRHLRIKAYYGTSENAARTQIWIAISVYVLIAIIKRRMNLKSSLYSVLQILSVSLFEKQSLNQALTDIDIQEDDQDTCNQLNLFE